MRRLDTSACFRYNRHNLQIRRRLTRSRIPTLATIPGEDQSAICFCEHICAHGAGRTCFFASIGKTERNKKQTTERKFKIVYNYMYHYYGGLPLLSAYFSATETAFSSANSTRLKTLAEKGNKNAALACRLLGSMTSCCLRFSSATTL